MPEPPPRRPSSGEEPTRPPSRPAKRGPKRGPLTYLFVLVVTLLVAFGVLQVAGSVLKDDSPALGDHWHAALGIDVCGSFAENPPSFEQRGGTDERAGVHSHGDGLIHIHPYADDETGDGATVGRFFEYGGWGLGSEGFAIWDGTQLANGDACPDGRAGRLRWVVNGEERNGNPADYEPEDGDVITIAFVPDGDQIPEPPSVASLPNPAR